MHGFYVRADDAYKVRQYFSTLNIGEMIIKLSNIYIPQQVLFHLPKKNFATEFRVYREMWANELYQPRTISQLSISTANEQIISAEKTENVSEN